MRELRDRPVGVVSLVTPWFDTETAAANLAATRAALGATHRVAGPDRPLADAAEVGAALDALARERVGALVLQMGTFPDGDAPARLATGVGVPAVVHSVPEPDATRAISLNSLCGANLATYTLTALAHPHVAVHGAPGDPAAAAALTASLDAALAVAWMREMRLGLIGFRAPGFYPCAFDELLLRRRLGVAVEHIGLQEVTERLARGERRPAPGPFATVDGGELDADARAGLERAYAALAGVLEDHADCSPVAVKDWPELWGMWPALGWLQDDGHVLGVEGDVHGAIGLALQRALSGGSVPVLADVSAWDDERSTLTLWHYGGAPSLARDPAEIRYDAQGQEVQFTLRPGRGTLARLGLHRGALRLLTVAVDVLDEPVALGRAAALARPCDTSAGRVVRTILDDGWEHHVSLVHGDVVPQLRALARLLDLPHTEL